MADIGEPIRRVTVVPLRVPVRGKDLVCWCAPKPAMQTFCWN